MSMGIKQVALTEAKAGTRLARDIQDAMGRVLMSAGTELTETSLASLQKRGIPHLDIEEPLSDQELSEQRQAVTQRLAHLFRRKQNTPLTARLYDAVLAYHLEQLS